MGVLGKKVNPWLLRFINFPYYSFHIGYQILSAFELLSRSSYQTGKILPSD